MSLGEIKPVLLQFSDCENLSSYQRRVMGSGGPIYSPIYRDRIREGASIFIANLWQKNFLYGNFSCHDSNGVY